MSLSTNYKAVYAGICYRCNDIADKLCDRCVRCEKCGHKPWCSGDYQCTEVK